MEKYIILADITCDLSEEMRTFCNMEDYVRGHVHIIANGGEQDFATTLDWKNIPCETYYKVLGDKHAKVSTAPPNLDEYVDLFSKYVKEGYKVLSMSISSGISSTYDFAVGAANRVKEQYPDAVIYSFDSYRMSAAFGLLVFYAHLLKQEGKSFEEVVSWLEANKQRVHQMGPIDDLMVIARRGRLSMGKAIMGSFAGVKPMGDCNDDGYVTVLTKAKGIRKALDLTVQYVKEAATAPEQNYAIIAHTDRKQYADALKAQLEAEVPFRKVFLTECFSGSAANIGPGMLGVYFFGEEISDLARERELMTKLTGK